MSGSAPRDYREQFNARGKGVLSDGSLYDTRRVMSWAPYFVVPTVAVVTHAVPARHRIKVWVSTLVFYGGVSVAMYNTDTAE